MAIRRPLASSALLALVACSDYRYLAPPADTLGTLVAIRKEGSADLASLIGLAEGAPQFLEPGQQLVWLGYGSSLEGLDVYAGAIEPERPTRAFRADPTLAAPSDIYELSADGPAEWAAKGEVPGWVLDLAVPYARPPPCPSFGAPQLIDLPERPNAITLFRGKVIAARRSIRGLSVIDTEDPSLAVASILFDPGAPFTALFASDNALFLGDEQGQLWRMGPFDSDELPTLLGTVSTSSCAIAAITGPDDGSEVVTGSRCVEGSGWSSNTGVISLFLEGAESQREIQLAWSAPTEAVMLEKDGTSSSKLRRITTVPGVEHLAPGYFADSVARLDRGVRIAGHNQAGASDQSLHCSDFGCGTKAPDAAAADWEIDTRLPLLNDNLERMVAFKSGLVYAATSGKVGYFDPSLPSCRPSPTSGFGFSVRGLDEENGKIVFSSDAATIGLVELSE